MASNEGASPSVVVDDSGRLRVLNPETNSHSRVVAQSCTVFESKLQHFQNLVKQLLDQAGEEAQVIEDAKLSAVGLRNMVSAEIETRPQKLRDRRWLIADKQEQVERLNAEYESLLMVKQEQEVLIARLSDSRGLRFADHDVVALDSSLRAEIQSPTLLRTMFQTELMALGKECAEVCRTLGKTMLEMKKHELHKVLERADEIAILLQHKIAKQSDLLLPCPAPSLHQDDLEDHAQTEQTDMTGLYLEKTEENGVSVQKIGDKLPDCKAAEFLKKRGSIVYHWECTVKRLAALSLLKFASILIEIAAKSKHVVGIVDELAEKAHFDEPSPEERKPSEEFISAFDIL